MRNIPIKVREACQYKPVGEGVYEELEDLCGPLEAGRLQRVVRIPRFLNIIFLILYNSIQGFMFPISPFPAPV